MISHFSHLGDTIYIDKMIAEGAMAKIYRGRLKRNDHEMRVVIKIPKMSIYDDAESVISFQVEASILPYIDGRSAPRFIASAPVTAMPFLAMQEIEGLTLSDWAKAHGKSVASAAQSDLTPDSADEPFSRKHTKGTAIAFDAVHRIGINFAKALSDLQSVDVVHHDLKPGNMMIGHSALVTLIDFGLAHHPKVPDLLAEESRQPVGSSITLAPEQLHGSRGDARSDQFAWGVIMYWLLMGEYPFGEEDSPQALKRRFWFYPDPPRAFRNDVPAWFQEIIYRCMAVKPSDRYACASHLYFDLTNPSSVALSSAGHAKKCLGLMGQLLRKFNHGSLHPSMFRSPSGQPAAQPIVLVALNPHQLQENALNQAIRRSVAGSLATTPGARLMCITVINPREVSGSDEAHSHANTQRRYLAMLQAWSETLLPAGSIPSFHVFEHPHPHEAIVRCAETNHVDVIVMGSRHPGGHLSGWLDSVSVRVAMQTHCSVLMVRPPRQGSGHESLAQRSDL
jgi:serine/threonine protein kinase/nucleotide-binding universal stress UspA family protein